MLINVIIILAGRAGSATAGYSGVGVIAVNPCDVTEARVSGQGSGDIAYRAFNIGKRTSSAIFLYDTLFPYAVTVTPRTLVHSVVPTLNPGSGAYTRSGDAFSARPCSAGDFLIAVGYTPITGGAWVSMSTTSLPYTITPDVATSATVVWTPTSFTLPADTTLVLRTENNWVFTGNGNGAVAVDCDLSIP